MTTTRAGDLTAAELLEVRVDPDAAERGMLDRLDRKVARELRRLSRAMASHTVTLDGLLEGLRRVYLLQQREQANIAVIVDHLRSQEVLDELHRPLGALRGLPRVYPPGTGGGLVAAAHRETPTAPTGQPAKPERVEFSAQGGELW